VPHLEKSGLFLHLNTNKRSLTLNLKTASGRAILLDLAQRANVVIENGLPGVMDDLGLGWEDLAEVNPKLVMTSITPFGPEGPYRDYASEEITVFAMTSRMYTHGQPDREPLRFAPDIAWFQVGQTAALATMGAVMAQERFGIGQRVDVSALEALIGNVDARTMFYTVSGQEPPPRSQTRQTVSSAAGILPCLDGFVLLIAGGERFFRRLLRAIGHPELAQDPRFADAAARAEHRDDFDAIFLPWILERTRREISATPGVQRDVRAVVTVDEAFTDPQRWRGTSLSRSTIGSGAPAIRARRSSWMRRRDRFDSKHRCSASWREILWGAGEQEDVLAVRLRAFGSSPSPTPKDMGLALTGGEDGTITTGRIPVIDMTEVWAAHGHLIPGGLGGRGATDRVLSPRVIEPPD
jgi:crotonobetainyl-CoA:carnitine CoA-transferase CaiB-like acyl-CoA transferase